MTIPKYFEFSCPVRIVSGVGALSNLAYEMEVLGARRAFVLTDKGVVNAGLVKHVEKAFDGSECEIGVVFDNTPPDSSTNSVREAVSAYKEAVSSAGSTIYRVRVGPYVEREEAIRADGLIADRLSIDGVVMSAD